MARNSLSDHDEIFEDGFVAGSFRSAAIEAGGATAIMLTKVSRPAGVNL